MATKKLTTCDYSDCKTVSDGDLKGWVKLKVMGAKDDIRDVWPEKTICPNHDAQALGTILVTTKADPKRLERKRPF